MVLIYLIFLNFQIFYEIIETITTGSFNEFRIPVFLVIFSLASPLIEFLIFFLLPSKWIKLQQEWKSTDIQLSNCKYNFPKTGWKCDTVSIIIMMSLVIQHIYLIQSLKYIIRCFDIFLLIISHLPRCVSNFTDLFIILISTGLAERYKLMNNFVINSSIWINHENYWYKLRIIYNTLSNLVKKSDDIISPLILLSFFNNFLYICTSLFIGISIEKDINMTTLYSFCSFGFFIIKMMIVLFSLSRVNEQSKIILSIIYQCPTSKFTIEAQRLQFQLSHDDVTLTGMNFFLITRRFLLTVAGTIITYEMFLMKLNVH
ncbi:hypothetical protein HCN44_009120 [Aphidius gifuensis]|uniref:Gustatory receptor n=1 Tax=Aphidius gifuensis TaxID=684658 RepID=A0A834Y4L5_APHGI|nr:hypothetical protein HCN44_009120 [Aphidius gifuensis]